jgi:hypothetical protein
MDRVNWKQVILAVLVGLIGAGVAVVVTETDDGGTRQRSVTIIVGGDRVVADRDQQMEASDKPTPAEARSDDAAPEQDLVDETPPGISRDESLDAQVTPPNVGEPLPAVGAQRYSCPANLVRNRSARAPGTRVSMFVLHIAVVRPGALAAVRRLFDSPAFGASSTLGIELDGECEQWVPYSQKPWTQGAFNSVSESVEIMTNLISRSEWLRAPIIRDGTLAAIVADRLRARGLPPRLVDPVGCTPVAGFTDHDRLECGNSHVDVGTGFPFDVFERQVRAAYLGPESAQRKPRKWCRSLRIVRAKAKRDGWRLSYRARGRALKRLLVRERYSCPA